MTKSKLSNAKRRAVNKLTPEELNANAHFNTTLVFAHQSVLHETYKKRQQAFIDVLTKTAKSEGLCPPIAAGIRREKTSQRTVETLLANIFNMKDKPTLSINLDHGKYSHTKLSGSGLVNLVKLASDKSHQLLILKKGFQDLCNSKNSRIARIKPTDKFYDLMESSIVNEDDIVCLPHDLINLRHTIGKGKNKKKLTISRKIWVKELTTEQKEWLQIIESSLDWFNIVIGEHEITYHKESGNKKHYLYPALYAVYSDDFQHGGRFYTGKGGHQTLSKEERQTIRFNGRSTTELDFGGMHVRMLYHLEGLDYSKDECPYMAVLRAMGKNPKFILSRYPDIKNDLKKVVFGLVNGKITDSKNTFNEAVNRIEYNLFNNSEENIADRSKRKKIWAKMQLLDDNGKPTKIIRAFENAHRPIQHQFYTGCGLPCLPIHDSFITFSTYKNKLEYAMKMVYKLVMQQKTNSKKPFEIPVK